MPSEFIQFHKPHLNQETIDSVIETLKSGWWTTGPKVLKFEEEFGKFIGAKYAIAVSSWTAAAHLMLEAINLKEGDEVIIPSITFTATAEIICYFNAVPVIVDVDPATLNIDPEAVEKAITSKTKAIIPVHYGGIPCDMDKLISLARKNNLKIIEDAAHAFPSYYKDKMIGTLGDATGFSFYVTKPLASGEGGMITTDDENIAKRASVMRLHGIDKDGWKRYTKEGSWYYEVIAPGFKYNFTDIQAAIAINQLKEADKLLRARKHVSDYYDSVFAKNELIEIISVPNDRRTSYHLYVIKLNLDALKIERAEFIELMKERGVGCSVHFIPLYKHPYYMDKFKFDQKSFPVSESEFPRLVSLPIYPDLSDREMHHISNSVIEILEENRR